MPKNNFGFIQKKYRQPDYEREVFCSVRAYYKAENGKLFMVVACPHFLIAEKWGADIDHYEILEQMESYCKKICEEKSQKKIMARLETLLENNKSCKKEETKQS